MKGFQIKINGQWVYLPEDFTIDLEQTNPVFNDQGTFSFPFEIPLEPNREIFKNLTDPFGDRSLREIDKSETEIWFNDVMLYRGVIDTDDEVEFEDSLPVTFTSGKGDFMSKIEGMNARDVKLDREIKLGYVVTKALRPDYYPVQEIGFDLPDFIFMNYTEYNVSDPWPIRPFCNVRLCASNENGYYKILGAKRPFSGVCFYVMYFLECLLKQLEFQADINQLTSMEDMARLAFFSTQCHVSYGREYIVPLSDIRKKDFCGEFFELEYYYKGIKDRKEYYETIKTTQFIYKGCEVFATNENFPDASVTDIIKDLETAFGIRILYDARSNRVDFVYIKDILKDNTVIDLEADILGVTLVKTKASDIRLTYGVEDDTAFNYTDYSNVKEYSNYTAILDAGISIYDSVCKIDTTTGNAYRTKVNKETGRNASLFEVGGFGDYCTNPDAEEENITEEKIGFTPVIVNAINIMEDADGVSIPIQGDRTDPRSRASEKEEKVYAVFADVELKSETKIHHVMNLLDGATAYARPDSGGDGSTTTTNTTSNTVKTLTIDALCPEYYDTESSEEPPLRNYDAGYTMGIMRGPGSESGLEIVTSDYDGEGNDSWLQTVGSYAFTSDSCDNYGRFFDYNGTESGGVDQSGRFSLKLMAQKEGFPIGDMYKGRGLVDKFLSENLFFTANRKTIQLPVDISITQIIGIDFLKRYRIGPYTGFINKISYTLGMRGVENAIIELYTL